MISDTSMDQILSDYEKEGVVRIRSLLSQDEVSQIRSEIARYERDIAPSVPAADIVFESDGTTIRNLWRLNKHDAFFNVLAHREDMLRLAGKLVHGKPVLRGVETFNKPSRVGSGVPYHQDNAYFSLGPPDAFTLWIAMDAATVENGAVYYRTGSHKQMLPHKASGVAGNSIGLADPPAGDPSDEFCGTLEPGDALAHHCQMVHRSDPNNSDHPRLALLMVYRGEHTQTDPELERIYKEAFATLSK
jgi:ectoine hydroxylase-related dioxygenase (phytanoyl-CoA dioxygenase family)